MRSRMPFGSGGPLAILAAASLTVATAWADTPPKPHEPKPKPAAPPPAPATAAAPTATAAAPVHSAAPATSGSAAPAGSGVAGKTSGSSALGIGRMEDRLEALRKRTAERRSTLDARRTAEQERTRLRWGSLVDQPAISAELRTHAEREARLERIEDLAEVEAKPAVLERAKRALAKENTRHETQMKALAGGAK